ncbi:hypothetical protein L5515_007791 [Caenorhabditis briggsae]|uniref:Uncharacterized protein n=1 Tax=Caenorhabditis briggsae TaxID=6238 RepID=A0AAE9F2U3_CAEBR|nr:hypothetical protein L5515_007791 [Caenorhabditis briggsae]
MSVDPLIVDAYLRLTNRFASEFGNETESISSLSDLWEKQDVMVYRLMGIDKKSIGSADRSADLFYDVLHRKIRMGNGSLAEALDPREAARGNLLEICKFYALILEVLRKDDSNHLTNILEPLAQQTGFNSSVLLDTFTHFDNLYSEDTVDEWWSCLMSTDDSELLNGLRTPTRNSLSAAAFATPTATARRLRTATSTARRSPIAEAVDSPTMKFMRSERDLKQAKIAVRVAEQQAEELELDNREQKKQINQLKLTNEELKREIAEKRESAEDAELRAQETSAALEAKQQEVDTLRQQLEKCREILRLEQRHLEVSEAEKETIALKFATASEDLEKCMKEMRRLRDSNEQESDSYRQKERELTDKLRTAKTENQYLTEHLSNLEMHKTSLQAENDRLKETVEELSLTSSRYKQDADNAMTTLSDERERLKQTISTLQREHVERMNMSKSTIERIQRELEEERKDKNELSSLLNELNEKALGTDKETHDQAEGFLSARACLEGAKKRIQQLELELKGKEGFNAVLERQIEKSKEILQTELMIREQSAIQFHNVKAELEEQSVNKDREIVLLKENMQNLIARHQNQMEEQQSALKACEKQIEELCQQVEELTSKSSEVGQKNCFLEERIKLFENMPRSPTRRSASPDSLLEFVATEEPAETEEESRRNVEQTPRKSVAFSVDLNLTEKGTPIGFKSNPRDSICSMDFFDRSSTARSSMISDTLTIGSNQDFKTPFTPSGTSKERVSLLASRNESVKPHLRSAYTVEMSNVNSPSGDEENVRRGGAAGEKKQKKRRDSIMSIFKSKN